MYVSTIVERICIDYNSAEQYTGCVVVSQYYFPIPSNFLNTTVLLSTFIVP